MGFFELLVIAIVGLIVFGPDKLPQLANNLGKAWGYFQRITHDVNQQVKSGMNQSGLKESKEDIAKKFMGLIQKPEEKDKEKDKEKEKEDQ